MTNNLIQSHHGQVWTGTYEKIGIDYVMTWMREKGDVVIKKKTGKTNNKCNISVFDVSVKLFTNKLRLIR